MNRFSALLHNYEIPSYITPLFWQHGEKEEILREEIRQMNENGIGSFIVESRPHPDFLGEKWWYDLDIIIDEAKKRKMKVWLFDDNAYPSGFSAGKIRDNHPEYLKVYLAEKHIDAIGPLKGSSFIVKAWLEEGDKLVGVVSAERIDGMDKIAAESLIDITSRVVDGILYWDIPEGNWRVFILISTRNGGEEGTRDYLNPLEKEPVRAFIDYIYEEHYLRYSSEFGKTIAGFFSDEPRFGNAPSYDAGLGKKCMEFPYGGAGEPSGNYQVVLPYSSTLLKKLDIQSNGSIRRYLPLLWYEGGEMTSYIRYTYMDVVSRLFAENYTGQIGNWCREHNVKLIGHVVEDNGAHARLGYGCGHFFRAIKGQDYSGLDVVYQIWPEYTSGRFTTPFGYLYSEFFYWGIAKMASSAGHIDPKKNGITVCEIFGAYGWQEGLKLMKWLTDHVCVRGINLLIPHAFSPKYPDYDCPPHFYARGENPQWRYFHIWSQYANRVCHLLSGGTHIAPVAVIYHAEAEWAGKYEPFESVVKTLHIRQIDCDIIPIDTIVNREALTIGYGSLSINNENYKVVVLPYAECLPVTFMERLLELADNKIHVVFIGGFPIRSCEKEIEFKYIIEKLKKSTYCIKLNHEELADKLTGLGFNDIEIDSYEEYLRYYHYIRLMEDIYFFTNESKNKSINTNVRFRKECNPVAYDALEDKICKLDYKVENGVTSVKLNLEPYESIFISLNYEKDSTFITTASQITVSDLINDFLVNVDWKVSTATASEYPEFKLQSRIKDLGNISIPAILPNFSGTIRYEASFDFNVSCSLESIILDLGEVYEIADVKLNGQDAGIRICPPYHIDVTDCIIKGLNRLQVDVTNTLAKTHGNNSLDRAMPQEPSGLIGPVSLLY